MTMNKAAVLLAALVSASFAAPVTDRANGLNIHKRGGPGYSDIVNVSLIPISVYYVQFTKHMLMYVCPAP